MILFRRRNALLMLLIIDIVKAPNTKGGASKSKAKGEEDEETQERLQQIAINMPNSEFISPCTDEFEHLELDCENGGTCMAAAFKDPELDDEEAEEDYISKCICPPYATGYLCEDKIDGCKSKPCVHGKCSKIKKKKDLPPGHNLPFLCECGDKHTGKRCETPLESQGQCSIQCKKDAKKSKPIKFKGREKKLKFKHITIAQEIAGECANVETLKVTFKKHGPQKHLDELALEWELNPDYNVQKICVCYPGYYGPSCDKKCYKGTYGQFCLQRCRNCNKLKCDRRTGECEDGCKLGFKGPMCDETDTDQKCKEGTATCRYGKCVNKGTEVKCQCEPGYEGVHCDVECDFGTYGEACQETCSEFCREPGCDAVTGKCPDHKDGRCIGHFEDKDRCLGQNDASVDASFEMVTPGGDIDVRTLGAVFSEVTESVNSNLEGGLEPRVSGKFDGFLTDFYWQQAQKQLKTEWNSYNTDKRLATLEAWKVYLDMEKSPDKRLVKLYDQRNEEMNNRPEAFWVAQAIEQLDTKWRTYSEDEKHASLNAWHSYLQREKRPAQVIKDLYDQRYDELMAAIDPNYAAKKDELEAFLNDPARGKRSPQKDPEELSAFLNDPKRRKRSSGRDPETDPHKTENKQQGLQRQKRQAETIKYAATVSFPADSAQTINLKDEVVTAATQTAKTFKSTALPGLKIDERSIDVSEAVVVLSSDNDSTAVSGSIIGVVVFLGLLVLAIVAALVVFRRKKAAQEKKNQKSIKNKSRQRSTATKKSGSTTRKSGSSTRKSGSSARKSGSKARKSGSTAKTSGSTARN